MSIVFNFNIWIFKVKFLKFNFTYNCLKLVILNDSTNYKVFNFYLNVRRYTCRSFRRSSNEKFYKQQDLYSKRKLWIQFDFDEPFYIKIHSTKIISNNIVKSQTLLANFWISNNICQIVASVFQTIRIYFEDTFPPDTIYEYNLNRKDQLTVISRLPV